MIKQALLLCSLSFGAFGASWTGMISDSACGTSHAKMLAEHKDMKTDKECTLACIRGGSQYVFVSNGKVYKLSNQAMAELKQLAGENVEVTGTMNGDSIAATKIAKK
jgi:hypothetical protein